MKTKEHIETSAVARFFSASVFKELSKSGRSPLLARLIRESGLPVDALACERVGDLFERAFQHLRLKSNRHEYVYKSAITHKVLLGTHSLNTASMVTEFRVGSCKADVVILNGTGTVYEIKSERDTLSRLSDQVDAYRTVFASVNVIVGENHAEEALSKTPEDVGIMLLCPRHRISTLREARDLPQRTSSGAIFDSINLTEAQQILSSAGIDAPDVPNTMRYTALRELFVQLPSEYAHREMVRTLKRTRNLQPLQSLLDDIPPSLYSISLTSRLRQKDHGRLVAALQAPAVDALGWG
ncbi:sce7726 family protein [Hyphomonas jannaschiana]|uniref:sce7726 family protein n=1 Tax=Hyphomonas jannaschiana TaxID=86 RepID=UPI0009E0A9A2|nr:sce7726 family protein [Hyphomonas jannaschiana]